MRSVHDIDVVILAATTLAAKRRPAQLVEIVAAAELVQGFIPFAEKIAEAIHRLSSSGLIGHSADGFTLTPAAEEIMAAQPIKAAAEERLNVLKERLAGYTPKGEFTGITLTMEQICAAILSHRDARKVPGKNMLMPKPKIERHYKVEGRWRKASTSRGRKS